MYNNEKIGVGIITCNRKESFFNLYTTVLKNSDIDYIIVVKNKNYNYDDYDPQVLCKNSKTEYINILEDKNIGFYKNTCLKQMIKNNCDHLFLIEDDIIIKRDDVFIEHVKTAKNFNQGHLNWNTLLNVDNNPTYTIINGENKLDISYRVCGCFSYFERDALLHVGLINDKDYINALEHGEHAYRFSLMKYTPPFFAFPGIHKGFEYLLEKSECSTINRDSEKYKNDLIHGFQTFTNTYGKVMNQIKMPTRNEVAEYIKRRINYE